MLHGLGPHQSHRPPGKPHYYMELSTQGCRVGMEGVELDIPPPLQPGYGELANTECGSHTGLGEIAGFPELDQRALGWIVQDFLKVALAHALKDQIVLARGLGRLVRVVWQK